MVKRARHRHLPHRCMASFLHCIDPYSLSYVLSAPPQIAIRVLYVLLCSLIKVVKPPPWSRVKREGYMDGLLDAGFVMP